MHILTFHIFVLIVNFFADRVLVFFAIGFLVFFDAFIIGAFFVVVVIWYLFVGAAVVVT